MAFKPIDFASIAPQGNPFFKDLVQNLATGYQAGQLPQKLERERQKEELANKMQELLVKEQPQKFGEESQERQLHNAFQSMLNQEQPQKFNSDQLSSAVLRAFQNASTNKINTMTPLEAQKAALENEWYPKSEAAKINEQNALATYRRTGGAGSDATAKAQSAFENSVAKDNPHVSPEDLFEATNVYREGGDTLSNGTKLNALSHASQTALDKIIKSSTTPSSTASKKTMQAIEGALPIIDKLLTMEEPNQATGEFTSPNAQADYLDNVTTLKERLIGSLNFPRTNQGAKELSHTTTRQPFESHKNYQNRLNRLKETLSGQYGIAKKYAGATSPSSKNSEKGTVEEEGTYEGKPIVKINGKWNYK